MSYDGDIAFMLSKPVKTESAFVQDTGILLTNRCDEKFFRSTFLETVEENDYQKTFGSEFLVQQKTVIFDQNGQQFNEKWFLKNTYNHAMRMGTRRHFAQTIIQPSSEKRRTAKNYQSSSPRPRAQFKYD